MQADIQKEVEELFEKSSWHSTGIHSIFERQEVRWVRATPSGIHHSQKVYIGKNKIAITNPSKKVKELFDYALSVVRLNPTASTINPYKNIELPLLGHHKKLLEKLLQLLIHANTILNINYRMKEKNGCYQSSREDYVNALVLIKDLAELYSERRSTYEHELISILQSEYKENEFFTRKELENVFGYCKTQTHRIIKILEERNIIIKAGGSKNRGYKYKLVC